MRHEITRVVHEVNRGLPVLNAHVHVQSENQVGPCYQLHVLNNVVITLVRINFLHPPVGKGMGPR